jgi:hypothetical protein
VINDAAAREGESTEAIVPVGWVALVVHDGEHEDAIRLESVDERVWEILQQRPADTRLDLGSHRGSLNDARGSILHVHDEAIGKLWVSLEVPLRGLIELDLRF